MTIRIGGVAYIAPLRSAAQLGIGRWRLEATHDGWVEQVTDHAPPAFANALRLAPRVTLLTGDCIGTTRRGTPEFVVIA